MATNCKESVSSTGISKWQLGMAIGVSTAIGFAVYYWWSRKPAEDKGGRPQNCVRPTGNCEASSNGRPNHAAACAKDTTSDELSKDPFEKSKAFKNKGNKFFKEGKYDKAIECYTEAISLCPPDKKVERATFYQNRAAAYENLKNFSEVINDCSKAIELNSTYIKALHRRAKIYETINELQKSLEDITAVCVLEGFQNQNSLFMTDRILKRLGRTTAREMMKNKKPILPSKHFIRNYFVTFSGDPISALVQKYKDEKVNLHNSVEQSGFRNAVQHLAEEDYEQIVGDCTVEIDRGGPDMAEALLLRGTFYLLQGQVEESHRDLERLMAMESVDVKVRVNALIKLGTMKIHAEQMAEALQDFDQAIELDPNNADTYLHRGQILLLMDRVDDALRDMEKSVALNPSFPSAKAQKFYVQYRCGVRYNDNKQRDEALQGFDDVRQNFPNCLESYFLYAQVLCEQQDFEKAELFFSKAGEIDPNDPNVYVHRAILSLQWKQNFTETLNLLQKAIDIDEKCQFAYETLGSIEVQRGNLQRGLEMFEKAISLAQTETDLIHLVSLRDAAEAQARVVERLGITLPAHNNT